MFFQLEMMNLDHTSRSPRKTSTERAARSEGLQALDVPAQHFQGLNNKAEHTANSNASSTGHAFLHEEHA